MVKIDVNNAKNTISLKTKIIKSNEIYNSCLCIPSSVDLSIIQLKKICNSINKIKKGKK